MCDTHGFSSIFCGSLCSDTSRLGRGYIRVLPPATIEYGTLRPIYHIISTTQQQPEKLDRKPRLPISSLPPSPRKANYSEKKEKKRKKTTLQRSKNGNATDLILHYRRGSNQLGERERDIGAIPPAFTARLCSTFGVILLLLP